MIFITVFLPAILYAVALGLTSPWRSVNWRSTILFFIGGIAATTFLQIGYGILNQLWQPVSPFQDFFFRAAPLEELAKWLSFWICWQIAAPKQRHPWQIMFYMAITGLGFATLENIHYMRIFGDSIIGMRLVTSTIAHQCFGMIAGYWIAIGAIKRGRGRTVFSVVTNRWSWIKRSVYWVIAIFTASLYHATYNWNLFCAGLSSSTILILILIAGIWASFRMRRSLMEEWWRRKGEHGLLENIDSSKDK
tara:strand:- start:8119 stop:8865 length:747 start_codon:yes stop_codon:yes gene_type:complete